MPSRGDRHPHDDLRQVGTRILGLAVAAEGGLLHFTAGLAIGAGTGAAAVFVPGQHLIGVPGLEIGRGGVEEQQVDLEVQQVGQVVVHLLAEVVFHGVQLVHRPVAGVVADLGKAVDVHVAGHPLGGGQLAGGRQGPVSHQREQRPLQRAAIQAAARHAAADHRVDAQPPP